MAVVVMWLFIYNLLQSSKKGGNGHQFSEMVPVGQPDSPDYPARKECLLVISSSTAGDDAELGQNTLQAKFESREIVGADTSGESFAPVCVRGLSEHWKLGRRGLQKLKWGSMITPPVLGVCLAILVGGTDPLQNLFVGKDAWLEVVMDVLSSLS
eukprot:TRINITY_DN1241_c0_g1_i2.p2 TRINITY_DN1241_c0_g1~~TRINITY_DN1241_c0_g1_i2.p2  ORF type:complete len:155 (-),score=22.75 TRINITY_DN1241_c0_g1_i2:552-1016(-)